MEECPLYLARAPCSTFIGLETESLVHCQERVGITSIVRCNLQPVIVGANYRTESGSNVPCVFLATVRLVIT